MEQAPVNLARRADITLTDPAESMSMISGQVYWQGAVVGYSRRVR